MRRIVMAATATLALVGCGGGSEGDRPEPRGTAVPRSDPAADRAAQEYRTKLDGYARAVSRLRFPRAGYGAPDPAPPSPTLEAVEGTSRAYEAARALQEDMKPLQDELEWVLEFDGVRAYEVDEPIRRNGRKVQDAQFRAERVIDDADFEHDTVVKGHRRGAAMLERTFRSGRAAVKRAVVRDELHESVKRYLVSRYDEALEQVDRAEDDMAELADYETGSKTLVLAAGADLPLPIFASLNDLQRPLSGALKRKIVRLARAGEAGPSSPRPGDAYRSVIVSETKEPYLKGSTEDTLEWMLFRIRELERTPDETYEPARQMILLEREAFRVSSRTAQMALIHHSTAAQSMGHGYEDRQGERDFQLSIEWFERTTDGPLAGPLAEMRKRHLARLRDWPTLGDGSTKQRLRAQYRRGERVRKGFDADRKELLTRVKKVRGLERTIAATRPAESS